MKKSILMFFIFSLTSIGFAQVDSSRINKNRRYCAELKDGLLVIVSDHKQITSDITTSNGTIIKANGNVIKKNGSTTILNVGECIDTNGLIVRLKNNDKSEKEN